MKSASTFKVVSNEKVVEPDPFEFAVNCFFELRWLAEGVRMDAVPQAESFVGGKERLVDWHKVAVDYQAVEAHRAVDGELPALANSAAFV